MQLGRVSIIRRNSSIQLIVCEVQDSNARNVEDRRRYSSGKVIITPIGKVQNFPLLEPVSDCTSELVIVDSNDN